ncbi:DUF342 domain-containing protein [Alkalicella caledoniensis]|uniref:DUF342 domain-containing protein n=1 Tax=Alkalicella caledoniensis TaxID=2731377 RepID=A0A7G9WCN1_ALKCA|nr:FapA family protein [Alkalicella caledoniensis]QNO16443.1 DUF342 domain-containing protein [Alkalicella caledoniensis]
MVEENVHGFDFTITFSKDGLEAYLEMDKMGLDLTESEITDVLQEIEKKGIVLNSNESEIIELIQTSTGLDKITIATGFAPIDGTDGYIEILSKEEKDGKPLVLNDGRVDFYNLGLVTNVYENDKLAVVHGPKDGTDGKDVKGNIIPFKQGKNPKIPHGKNIKYNETTGEIIALINGQVSFGENSINVFEVLEVKDVDFKTGNIDFVGNVIVNGAVKDGFTVIAHGDVTVRGYVDSSFIVCKGNLTVSGGIQGRNKGKVDAGGNVVARYIENCEIRAGGSIIVKDAIMHSKAYAKEKIIAVEGKGLLVGGLISAGKEIQSKTMGSHLATVTELEVGVNPELRERLQSLAKDLNQKIDENKKAKQAQRILGVKQEQLLKIGKDLPPEQKGLLIRLKFTTKHLDESIKTLQSEQQELMEKLLSSASGSIKGHKTVYPGVRLTIGTKNRNISDILSTSTFTLASDGEITIS